jgi:RNA polymerase sigma-70 factor (ECF subfamily)
LERVRQRDESALLEIMQAYNKLLWVIAAGILSGVGTAEDIEECVSDVYVRFWNEPEKHDPSRGSLKIYLSVMSKSMALNMYEKLRKGKNAQLHESLADDEDFIEQIFTRDMSRRIYKAIMMMDEPDKEILIRRLFLNQKPAFIAEKLGLPAKEVENRIYRKKQKIRQCLGGDV